MAEIQLFPRDQVVGIFRGFQQEGMEFHADLVLPYRLPHVGSKVAFPNDEVLREIDGYNNASVRKRS